ncbi:MAG TPA: PAS domain-containing protein, partial [Dehalococcoidia bacterium]
NTLMYLNPDAQARALSRLFFAMNPQGYLFLGKAETLFAQSPTLHPVDLPMRVFKKTATSRTRERMLPVAERLRAIDEGQEDVVGRARLRDIAFETAPSAQIIVDGNGRVAAANNTARLLFSIHRADIGRPLEELEISHRPVDLRQLIETAHAESRDVTSRGIEWNVPINGRRMLDLRVLRLSDEDDAAAGAALIFEDATDSAGIAHELRQSRVSLDSATREMQSMHEEMLTMNEKLQSTLEELEATNAELQCTNEELETMNQELQSANDALEGAVTDLHARIVDVQRADLLLNTVFEAVPVAVAVVDRELAVRAWNNRCDDLWGNARGQARGRDLFKAARGLPETPTREVFQRCVTGASPREDLSVIARAADGEEFLCQIISVGIGRDPRHIEGAAIIMIDSRIAQLWTSSNS